jgi:hypothetical protein
MKRWVGEVLSLLLPPWELRACVVPAVRDAPPFARSVAHRSFGRRGLAVVAPALGAPRVRRARCAGLAVAAPALGAPRVRRARCARCACVCSLGGAPLLRSARSCRCCSRPGSSARASCPLCAMRLRLLARRGAAPSVGEVLLLLLPPWELRACVVPAVRDAPAFARSVAHRSFPERGSVRIQRPPSIAIYKKWDEM